MLLYISIHFSLPYQICICNLFISMQDYVYRKCINTVTTLHFLLLSPSTYSQVLIFCRSLEILDIVCNYVLCFSIDLVLLSLYICRQFYSNPRGFDQVMQYKIHICLESMLENSLYIDYKSTLIEYLLSFGSTPKVGTLLSTFQTFFLGCCSFAQI